MASFTDTIAILIKADGAAAAREFKRVGDTARQELGKAEGATKNYSAMFTKMGVGLTTTAAIGGVALYKLGQDASDLAETINKSSAIFGDAADEVSKFGDDAAESIGLSKRAAVDAVSGFGALAKGLGFTQEKAADFGIDLTKLASDMASFSNTSADEAVLALGSALRGESEPIRRYNVLLNETAIKTEAYRAGIAKQGDALTEAQKVQARYNLILKQTADQQGDWERTSGGAAGQQKILTARMEDLRAKIGAGVLPAMTQLLSVVSSGVDVFSSMDEATGGMVGKLATIGVGAAGAIGGISLLAGQLSKLKNLALADPTAGLSGGLSRTGKAMAAAGAATVVALGIWQAFEARSERAAAAVRALTDAVEASGKSLEQVAAQQLAKYIGETDGVSDALKSAGVSVKDYANALLRGGDAYDTVQDKLSAYESSLQRSGQVGTEAHRGTLAAIQGLDKQRDAYVGAKESIEGTNAAVSELRGAVSGSTRTVAELGEAGGRTAKKMGELGDESRRLGGAHSFLVSAQRRAGAAADGHGRSLRDLIAIAQDYRDRVLGMRDSTRDFATAQLDAADANARVGEAQKAMNEAVAEFGPNSAEAAQATRDYQRSVIDASQSQDDAARAAIDHAKALAGFSDTEKNTEAVNRKFKASLVEVAGTLQGPAKAAVLAYVATLNTVPPEKNTDVRTKGVEASRAGVQGLKRDVDALHDKTITITTNFEENFTTNGVTRRAKGGPVKQGELYRVGEEGEEFFIPGANGTILPNSEVRRIRAGATGGRPLELSGAKSGGGGDTIIINFHGPVASQRQAEDWVTNALASARRRGAA